MAFTLEGDCTAAEPENVFKDLLRTQLAAELQISESEINNVMFTCGKIFDSYLNILIQNEILRSGNKSFDFQ